MAVPYDSYYYPGYWMGREYEHLAEEIALKKLFTQISQKNSLVDIGGGFGRLANIYSRIFKNCLLIDPSEKLLKIAREKLKKLKNIKFKKGKAQSLPIASEKFDAALMVRVIHHLPRLQKPIKETYRVLNPGGFLILEFANKIHLKSVIKAILGRKLGYLLSHIPEDISRSKNVPFFNYHPNHVKSLLLANEFKVIKTLSVSNLRHPLFKKFIPLKIILFLESLLQPLLARVSFGPSIFILARKKNP